MSVAVLSIVEKVLGEMVVVAREPAALLVDLQDGSGLARRMINRTFLTSMGSISFDENGERRPLLLSCSYFNVMTASFTVRDTLLH